MHFFWTSTTTHPLGLSWRMTPFPHNPKPAFIPFRARGHGYGWLSGHLSVCFASHTLLSPQRCIFISIWFNHRHLIFSCVNVDISLTHMTRT
jgi:hypothetical protein